MLGFVRKSTAEWMLKERERVIQILSEQLQYCRATQQGGPTDTIQRAVRGEEPVPEIRRFEDETPIEVHEIPTEDEEQLDAMLQAGAISPAEHARAIEALKSPSPDSIIE